MIDELICPFSMQSGNPLQCKGQECRAHRQLCEEKYDRNGTTLKVIKGICLLIPGDDAR